MKSASVKAAHNGPLTANDITAQLLIEIPKRFPGRVWVYRNNRLEAKAVGRNGKTRHVSAGINGQGDLSGILTVEHAGRKFGVRIEIEVKATYAKGKDRMSPSQLSMRSTVQGLGGLYLLAEDVDGCLAELERACG